jgi:dolichol-phosphate mannosyltransferase
MITLVLPTYNEYENIGVLVEKIEDMGLDIRLAVVDDNSPDGTGALADGLAKKYSNLKVFHRRDERGLGSAIKFGFVNSKSDYVGVMDTDLSHDSEALRLVIKEIENGADFVIGSRYANGGMITNWPLVRRLVSKIATLMVRPITSVKDPMSGFFFIKKAVIKKMDINPESCKICLDIIVRGDYKKLVEVPYKFTNRKKGETKILKKKEILKYIKFVFELYRYKISKL